MDILSQEKAIHIETRTFNKDWTIAESNFGDKDAAAARCTFLRTQSKGEVYRVVGITKVVYNH